MTPPPPGPTVRYRRSRFSARLPAGRRYTRSHYWLDRPDAAGAPDRWQVGLTAFATRMLGDLVECILTAEPGDPITVGQRIGSIEGFKAISDIYAVASGRFAGANAALDADITLMESSPWAQGWLYAVDGAPDPASLDVAGYVQVLDATIDRMLASRRDHADGGADADDGEDGADA